MIQACLISRLGKRQVCRKNRGRWTDDVLSEGLRMYPLQVASPPFPVVKKGVSGVPECWAGLSEFVASVFFDIGVGDKADERESLRVQGAQRLTIVSDAFETIVVANGFPVGKLTIFKNSLYYLG